MATISLNHISAFATPLRFNPFDVAADTWTEAIERDGANLVIRMGVSLSGVARAPIEGRACVAVDVRQIRWDDDAEWPSVGAVALPNLSGFAALGLADHVRDALHEQAEIATGEWLIALMAERRKKF